MKDTRFLKDKSNNPMDWFNLNATFEDIFYSKKEYTLIGNEIKSNNTVYFIWSELSIECLIENDPNNPKGIFSKYHYLVQFRFQGNEDDAYSFVKYTLQKNEFPYIRVGIDFYKVVTKTNRYNCPVVELKQWSKTEIKTDHPGQTHLIKKYNDFTIVPDNVNYKQSINGFYNQYPKFPHEPVSFEVTEEQIPTSIEFLIHIFGEQYDLGLKYMKILYENPQQAQYILCLVSEENSTGKTTFINWLSMIFGHNAVQIGPDNLSSNFNYIYATKNIIMIEEAVSDKKDTVEKLKALSTQKFITVNRKNVSEYELPFFGKFLMCTNKVDDFIRINKEETRFWIRKVNKIEVINTLIEKELFDEIPMFLKFLLQQSKIDFSKHRNVFLPEEIQTDAVLDLKKESQSGLYKDLTELITNMFLQDETLLEIMATPIDLKERFFKHTTIEIHYIKRVLKNEFKIKPRSYQMRYCILDSKVKDGNGFPYTFKRKDYI